MIESDVILHLALIALLTICGAAFVFSFDTRGTSSFRIFPSSSAEWIAYWFHFLEFTLLCGTFMALHPAARHYPNWAAPTLGFGISGSAFLLVISVVAFWWFDRTLCCHALLWLLFLLLCLFLLFPALGASRA